MVLHLLLIVEVVDTLLSYIEHKHWLWLLYVSYWLHAPDLIDPFQLTRSVMAFVWRCSVRSVSSKKWRISRQKLHKCASLPWSDVSSLPAGKFPELQHGILTHPRVGVHPSRLLVVRTELKFECYSIGIQDAWGDLSWCGLNSSVIERTKYSGNLPLQSGRSAYRSHRVSELRWSLVKDLW